MTGRRPQAKSNATSRSKETVNKPGGGTARSTARLRNATAEKSTGALPVSLPPSLLNYALKNPSYAQALLSMLKFGRALIKKGVVGCKAEFKQIKQQHIDFTHKAFDANVKKCRYKDVFCADRTRVVLKGTLSDFIHANHVTHEYLMNPFICCQGPLPHTSRDFWLMVWQQNAVHVFMLCRCSELGKAKCFQYWPALPGETIKFGPFTVRNLGVSQEPQITLTKLALTYGKTTRQVEHRQWITWPDRFVPQHVEPAFRLLDLARSTPQNPTVVHCSAGIGRTGTLVMIECLQRSLNMGLDPNPLLLLISIRQQRIQAVQTEDQYVFVNYAILQLILRFGVISQAEAKPFIAEYVQFLRNMGAPPPVPLPVYNDQPVMLVAPQTKDSKTNTTGSVGRTRSAKRTRAPQKSKMAPVELPEQTAISSDRAEPPSTMTCVDPPDLEMARHIPGRYFDDAHKEYTAKEEASKKSSDNTIGQLTGSAEADEQSKKAAQPAPRRPIPLTARSLREARMRDKRNDDSTRESPCTRSGRVIARNSTRASTDSEEDQGSVYYHTGLLHDQPKYMNRVGSKKGLRKNSKKDVSGDEGSDSQKKVRREHNLY